MKGLDLRDFSEIWIPVVFIPWYSLGELVSKEAQPFICKNIAKLDS